MQNANNFKSVFRTIAELEDAQDLFEQYATSLAKNNKSYRVIFKTTVTIELDENGLEHPALNCELKVSKRNETPKYL